MSMNVLEVMSKLPHRYPFLMVDKIISLIPGKEIEGIKNVSINEPFFQGHFPQAPVMPGVLIVEAMAQVGGILALQVIEQSASEGVVYLMGLDKVRFRKPVMPGDQLHLKLRILKQKGLVFKLQGEAFVDGELVAEAQILATLEDKKETEE